MTTIPSWARPGVRVVCIREAYIHDDSTRRWAPNTPVHNDIYTIRRVLVGAMGVGFLLREIHNPVGIAGKETGFNIRDFRPAVEPLSEDEALALFRHHLTAPHSSSTAPGHADA